MPAIHEYHTRRRIEFVETDMGGIVHFSRFYVFMEQTEHAFLRRLGANSASCQFLSPARFGDELDIHLRVLRKGTSSLTYGFDIRLGEIAVARGQVTTVYCQMDAPGGMKAMPIPPEVAGLIDQVPS